MNKTYNPPDDEEGFDVDTPNARYVWITNRVTHDYSSASVYGTVKDITRGSQAHKTNEQLDEEIADFVWRNVGASDYILLSGNLLITSLVVFHALANNSEVNFLIWDGFLKEYTHLRVKP